MNAHVFRRVILALSPLLSGARLEKIHAPFQDVSQWVFYGQGQKLILLVRTSKRQPFIFLGDAKIPVGAAPPNYIMRMRKYLEGRRVNAIISDWSARRLWLRFTLESQIWLCLDLSNGISLHFSPPEIEQEVLWPCLADVQDMEQAWQKYPILSPDLRRTLQCLEPEEQQALLLDLEQGEGDLFVYDYPEQPELKPELCAWYLPAPLRKGRREQVFEDVLEAAKLVGLRLVIEGSSQQAETALLKPHEREKKRLVRLLEKLNQEEVRLRTMLEKQPLALLIQANLYKFNGTEKTSTLEVTDASGQLCNIELDKRLNLIENMEFLFKQAARGRRGLTMLTERRISVEEQLRQVEYRTDLVLVDKQAELKSDAPILPKGVQAFKSSAGLLILRGRDAKGNMAALKLAKSYDLWFHAQGQAGAHVVIRLNYAGQIVPEQTLQEAAILAALKSQYSQSTNATIECAFVKHVHPMRGKLGMVRIDRHEPSLTVSLDFGLEQKLMWK